MDWVWLNYAGFFGDYFGLGAWELGPGIFFIYIGPEAPITNFFCSGPFNYKEFFFARLGYYFFIGAGLNSY